VYTDRFDDPGLEGEMQTTVQLKKVSVGTEVNIVQEGIPSVIPIDACTSGGKSRSRFLPSSLSRRSLTTLRREPAGDRKAGENISPAYLVSILHLFCPRLK
jgi:hypothetical protein